MILLLKKTFINTGNANRRLVFVTVEVNENNYECAINKSIANDKTENYTENQHC